MEIDCLEACQSESSICLSFDLPSGRVQIAKLIDCKDTGGTYEVWMGVDLEFLYLLARPDMISKP